ncbi:MAG: ornithine carbamoyltransferase [Candidatus Aenigmatarchaeota archaeon]|nr:MAG: ornithine carbamoyltransferase [Candidatus Aenigmarchaeota archaeon]
MVKHFLTLLDYSEKEIKHILDLALKVKVEEIEEKLENQTLAMLFEKSSTRTRVSFEVGMTQLGGHAIYLDMRTTQLGRGETIEDTIKTIERYCDVVMARVNKHSDLEKMASVSKIPIINGLSEKFHPCQTMADMLTVLEKKGKLDDLKVVFLGDCGFNMFNSTMIGFSKMWSNVVAVCPDKKGYAPDLEILEKARKYGKGSIKVEHDPIKGIKDADVIHTDTWVSMGQEDADKRIKHLKRYQLNSKLLEHAKDAIVMHCLPAHRGHEITDDVVDGPQSVVFDQAENRLHAQNAILLYLLKGV